MKRLDVPIPQERCDERDTMFSRAALEPGSDAYEAAYKRRPDLREIDDSIRSLPRLTEPGTTFFEPSIMEEVAASFQAIEAIQVDEAWLEEAQERFRRAEDPSAFIKRIALELGATAAGWAPLIPAYLYSHKGRFAGDYGREIAHEHSRALVFLVEMDFQAMRNAPKAPTLLESARQYYRAARISLSLEALLCRMDCAARSQHDAHYEVLLPPLAVLAGLGEMGRNNILITDRFGSRVRIGCVTTNLPGCNDAPRSLGVDAFCKVCGKCAENCPGKALSLEGKSLVRGVLKWPTRVERCYRYWRQVGTDCGICMASCPFSHRDTTPHNLVRWMVRHLPWLNRLLVWGDALAYGRRWRCRA